jgi:tetratricopeptide (TPR) repeat protein
LGIAELALITLYLAEIVQSSMLAITLGSLFLTFFSYFILKLYLESKKPEFIFEVKEKFVASCKELIGFKEEVAEHHLAVANACTRFAAVLQGKEHHLYCFPKWLDFLDPTMEKISVFCHWHDLHHFRELLLLEAVNEHIELVKFEPTDLEVHAALANAYVLLSGLYINPNHHEPEEDRFFPGEKFREILERKFLTTAERAIEEFKILNDFAPHDPWVHLQLAYSYHDLGMPEEEIREYETILELCPDDRDALFKLGVLYFEQGENAKGLQVYEELKGCNFMKAEELITYYGIYTEVNSKAGL